VAGVDLAAHRRAQVVEGGQAVQEVHLRVGSGAQHIRHPPVGRLVFHVFVAEFIRELIVARIPSGRHPAHSMGVSSIWMSQWTSSPSTESTVTVAP
jgi:hypothetical protein